MHYYQFNIGDYMRDTQHLDEMEDLVYRRLLDLCYLSEAPLPLDVKEVARRIRMRSECERIADVLREFFTATDEGYINPRASSSIEAYKQKGEKARASAKARWNKNNNLADANALRPECEPDADGMLTNNHKPLTINQEPDLKTGADSSNRPAAKKGSRLTDGFIVPDEWLHWATEEFKGLGSGVNRIAVQFVDYWIAVPGAKGVKLDWFATWKNWVRRDLDRQRPAPQQQRPAPAITQMAEAYQQRIAQGGAENEPRSDEPLW